MNLRNPLRVLLLTLTSMGHWLSLKRCHWLEWRVWCHSHNLVAWYYLKLGICNLIKPTVMEKRCYFLYSCRDQLLRSLWEISKHNGCTFIEVQWFFFSKCPCTSGRNFMNTLILLETRSKCWLMKDGVNAIYVIWQNKVLVHKTIWEVKLNWNKNL